MPQIFHRLSGQSITQPHFCKTLPKGLTPEMRRQAEEHVQAAAGLIEETCYHRR